MIRLLTGQIIGRIFELSPSCLKITKEYEMTEITKTKQENPVCPRCGIPMIAQTSRGKKHCLFCNRVPGLSVPGAIIEPQSIMEALIALLIPGPVIFGSDQYARVKAAITRRCRLIQF